MRLRPLLIIAACLFLAPLAVFSQEPRVCISQSAANVCAANSRENSALREKIGVLEAALLEKDKSIAELRDAGSKNVADLTKALHETEIKLATATGQLIGVEAEKTRLLAIIDFMLKNGRTKKYGLINF